jgi:hypothetical protein
MVLHAGWSKCAQWITYNLCVWDCLIEMIWALMKARVRAGRPQTQEELKNVITRVSDEPDEEHLRRMVISFSRRVEMLSKARGRSISHRNDPTQEDAGQIRIFSHSIKGGCR